MSLDRARLYLCTADRPDLERFLVTCLKGGVDVVQLRDKHLDDVKIIERASTAKKICADFNVPLIVNDRADLCFEAGADGVHLGQDDSSPTEARELLGKDAIIGCSTHAKIQLKKALGQPISYLSAGPVESTPTKPGRLGTGLSYPKWAAKTCPLPVFVTGGVNEDTIDPLLDAGIRHFVVVRYLCESNDPQGCARKLLGKIDQAWLNDETSPTSIDPAP